MTATPTPLRELPAKWRSEADDCDMNALEADSIGLNDAAKASDRHARHLRDCADDLEAALSARQEEGAVDWREVASEAIYVGLCIGVDCAGALADLQDRGVYKPRCDDGKPSNASARRDFDKLADIYKRGLALLRNTPETRPAAPSGGEFHIEHIDTDHVCLTPIATPPASGEAGELAALLERLASHPLVGSANYGDANGPAICTRAAALIRRLAARAPSAQGEVATVAMNSEASGPIVEWTEAGRRLPHGTKLYTSAPAAGDGDAVFTHEEVEEAIDVLRGRHGSTALIGEVLDDMERVLLAAATPPATAGAVYRCDYCGSDYTQAKYCCQARRDYLNAHGQYETATPPASGEAGAKDDPHEFGCGIEPNPKASYWQERAAFWCAQAKALGYVPSDQREPIATPPAASGAFVATMPPDFPIAEAYPTETDGIALQLVEVSEERDYLRRLLFGRATQGEWVPVKPEGAPYWGIHTADGRTVAGTSSGLSEYDAKLICSLRRLAAVAPPASAGAVPYAELPAKMAYDIDPDTGADRGSCCGHAYADGWNDCIEAVRRVPATPPAASGDDEAFADWLAKEMPPSTVISNPRWWAPRILRATRRLAAVAPAGMVLVPKAQLEEWHRTLNIAPTHIKREISTLLAASTPPATAGQEDAT